jgi:hypothetical protein
MKLLIMPFSAASVNSSILGSKNFLSTLFWHSFDATDRVVNQTAKL